jgi:hypothetical protein
MKIKTVEVVCDGCGQLFDRYIGEVKRSQRKHMKMYCAQSCTARYRVRPITIHEPNVICAHCNKAFYKNPSSLSNSKSGLFFCCREHKDISQRIGNLHAIREIMPNHYGTDPNKNINYRKLAFDHLPNECEICQWKEYPNVLIVHHKDRNRNNNVLENLQIICPTHHDVDHYLQKDGRFTTGRRHTGINRSQIKWPPIPWLLERSNQIGVRQTALEINVSDTGLRHYLRRNGIDPPDFRGRKHT